MRSATVYIAEDKAQGKMMDATRQLQDYASGGLNANHYGDLQYIFGHAAALPELRFVIITSRGQVKVIIECRLKGWLHVKVDFG